jgi:hypothetical protein
MRDVLMLLLIAAFFALCVAYVWWCDQIIGLDPVSDHVPDPVEAADDPTTDQVNL